MHSVYPPLNSDQVAELSAPQHMMLFSFAICCVLCGCGAYGKCACKWLSLFVHAVRPNTENIPTLSCFVSRRGRILHRSILFVHIFFSILSTQVK